MQIRRGLRPLKVHAQMRDELELDWEKDTGSYDGEFTIIGADCVGYCSVRPRPSRQVRRTVTVTRTGSEDHVSGHGHSDCTTSTFPA